MRAVRLAESRQAGRPTVLDKAGTPLRRRLRRHALREVATSLVGSAVGTSEHDARSHGQRLGCPARQHPAVSCARPDPVNTNCSFGLPPIAVLAGLEHYTTDSATS